MNIGVHVSLSILVSLVCMSSSGIAGSKGSSWTEVCDIVQEGVIKTIPKKKKCKQGKWLSEEALKIAEKRRETKSKGGKKDIPI